MIIALFPRGLVSPRGSVHISNEKPLGKQGLDGRRETRPEGGLTLLFSGSPVPLGPLTQEGGF